ncbi:hypothetical protein ACHMZP_32170 [Rhodococcus baikonurensis]|nr:hypothetical protein [Rhodococcus erythropolis]
MNTDTIAAADHDKKLLIAAALVNGYPTPIHVLCQQHEPTAA